MNPGNQDEIAKRAYAIWQREGQPDGRDSIHWHMAEQELARQDRASEREDRASERLGASENGTGNGAARAAERPAPRKPTLVRSRPRKSST